MALTTGFFTGIGQGVGDIFGAIGDFKEAGAYGEAAQIAQQNAVLAKESGAIQEMQAGRKIYQTLSAQSAEVSGAGLKVGAGSAGDLYRSSVQQGALTKQLIGIQTGINVGSYQQEAAAYTGMQDAAKAAGEAGIANGVGNILGSFFGLSDDTAKENITFSRPSRINGIGLYLYSYKGTTPIFLGPLASEVEKVRPDCMGVDSRSVLRYVNFQKLGMIPVKVGDLNDA